MSGIRGGVGVTGASGFLGRHVVTELDRLGTPVTPITRRREDFGVIRGRVADLGDPLALADALRTCETVIHLAAVTPSVKITSAPEVAAAVNLGGTANVIEACRLSDVRRIVFVSSGKVYGSQADGWINESAAREPGTMLGRQKLAAEMLLEAETRRVPSLSVATLRMFNVYGPGQRPAFLIPKIIEHLDAGTIALGDLNAERDFLFVSDAVAAIVTVLLNRQPGFEAYNVGTGVSTAIADVVATVARVSGRPLKATFDPAQVRGNEPAVERSDSGRIGKLGWPAQIDLESGLRCLAALPNLEASSVHR